MRPYSALPGGVDLELRIGPELVLRGSLDEEGKSRVRVAAEASASPKLRVALDAAASDGSDLAAHEALAALAGDVVVDRVIDATVDMPPPTDSEKKARLG